MDMSKCQPRPAPTPRKQAPPGWALTTFRKGFEAAKMGEPASANPYSEGSDQAAVWNGGWQNATSE